MKSTVVNFYKNKNIFITGGTGFLGTALIEKILRSCKEVGTIYILIRPKDGKSIENRLQEFKKNIIFLPLLENNPDILKKLKGISGDLEKENLGLSKDNRELLIDNVNVVFHSGANTDFDVHLKYNIIPNFLGTRRVMELSQQLKNLKALVHVSSAYVNSSKLETEEVLYRASEDADEIMEQMETFKDKALDKLTKFLLKDHLNSYKFTKYLAEHEVNKYAEKFPCALVRPSQIIAAWKEPLPGWIISKGGQEFMKGVSKGIIRRFPVEKNSITDYIPVDIVVNQILVTGKHIDEIKCGELSIFHCTSSTCNPFRWKHVEKRITPLLHLNPVESSIWYPHLKLMPNMILFKISAIFMHFLPALILDFLTKLNGEKPSMIRLHVAIWKQLNNLEKYIFTEWKFHNTNTLLLAKSMLPADQQLFNIDISSLKWPDHFSDAVRGAYRFLIVESPRNLAAARKRDNFLKICHNILQLIVHVSSYLIVSYIFNIPLIDTFNCFVYLPINYHVLLVL